MDFRSDKVKEVNLFCKSKVVQEGVFFALSLHWLLPGTGAHPMV